MWHFDCLSVLTICFKLHATNDKFQYISFPVFLPLCWLLLRFSNEHPSALIIWLIRLTFSYVFETYIESTIIIRDSYKTYKYNEITREINVTENLYSICAKKNVLLHFCNYYLMSTISIIAQFKCCFSLVLLSKTL